MPFSVEDTLSDDDSGEEKPKNLASLLDDYLADDPDIEEVPESIEGYAYYYETLGNEEQTCYRQIYYGVSERKETITLAVTDADTIHRIYRFVLYDHPELFWCSGSSQSSVYTNKTEFKPEYTLSEDEITSRQAEIDAAVKDCLSGIDGEASTYEKLYYIYTWIIDTVDYDKDAPDNQNIYSALVGHASVCAGYSKAFQYLLRELSIPAIYVTGSLKSGGTHAWNMIRYQDNWYNVDTTFGDPVFMSESNGQSISISYAYLCCTDGQLSDSHVADDQDLLPKAEQTDLNYYRLIDRFIEYEDYYSLKDMLTASVNAGEESFSVQCASDAVYQAVCDDLLNSILPDVSQTYMTLHGLSQVYYHYSLDDSMYLFSLSWN